MHALRIGENYLVTGRIREALERATEAAEGTTDTPRAAERSLDMSSEPIVARFARFDWMRSQAGGASGDITSDVWR